MKTVKLTGRLGKEFGEEFQFEAASPAECIRALCTQLEGFEPSVKEGLYRVTRIYDGSEQEIDENELSLSFGKSTGIRIEPIPGGRKRGLGKAILGLALVAFAWWAAPAMVGMSAGAGVTASSVASGTSITVAGVSTAKISSFGTLLVLQGASALLTPTPKAPKAADQQESYLLDGTGNLLEQGNPVPLIFGEAFAGSMVISAGLVSEEIIQS